MVNVITMRKIADIFVAFSEKLNFLCIFLEIYSQNVTTTKSNNNKNLTEIWIWFFYLSKSNYNEQLTILILICKDLEWAGKKPIQLLGLFISTHGTPNCVSLPWILQNRYYHSGNVNEMQIFKFKSKAIPSPLCQQGVGRWSKRAKILSTYTQDRNICPGLPVYEVKCLCMFQRVGMMEEGGHSH